MKLEAIQAAVGAVVGGVGFAMSGVLNLGALWVEPGTVLKIVGVVMLADYFLERVLTAWRTKAR